MTEIDLEELSTERHGYTLDEQDEDDPLLLDRAGSPVETWRENYPYDERLGRQEYERVKRRLQIELLKLQNWSKRTGARHAIVFEGRDAAGKGGTISSDTFRICPSVERSCTSTAPGTTGLEWSA